MDFSLDTFLICKNCISLIFPFFHSPFLFYIGNVIPQIDRHGEPVYCPGDCKVSSSPPSYFWVDRTGNEMVTEVLIVSYLRLPYIMFCFLHLIPPPSLSLMCRHPYIILCATREKVGSPGSTNDKYNIRLQRKEILRKNYLD